jgi:hypothetical protein
MKKNVDQMKQYRRIFSRIAQNYEDTKAVYHYLLESAAEIEGEESGVGLYSFVIDMEAVTGRLQEIFGEKKIPLEKLIEVNENDLDGRMSSSYINIHLESNQPKPRLVYEEGFNLWADVLDVDYGSQSPHLEVGQIPGVKFNKDTGFTW